MLKRKAAGPLLAVAILNFRQQCGLPPLSLSVEMPVGGHGESSAEVSFREWGAEWAEAEEQAKARARARQGRKRSIDEGRAQYVADQRQRKQQQTPRQQGEQETQHSQQLGLSTVLESPQPSAPMRSPLVRRLQPKSPSMDIGCMSLLPMQPRYNSPRSASCSAHERDAAASDLQPPEDESNDAEEASPVFSGSDDVSSLPVSCRQYCAWPQSEGTRVLLLLDSCTGTRV